MKWCAKFGQWIGHIFTAGIRGVTATCIVSYEGSYRRGKHQHTGYDTQKKAAIGHGSCHRECRSCQWRAEHPEAFRDKMHFKPVERPARSDCVDCCGHGSTAARRPRNPTFTATSGNGSFASRGSASLRISSAASLVRLLWLNLRCLPVDTPDHPGLPRKCSPTIPLVALRF